MSILKEALNILNLDLKTFDLKNLTTKKTYLCALNKEIVLFIYTGKSRFILKNALFLENLANNFNQNKKLFFIKSALCSKANQYLSEKGFNIYAIL
ncbi:tram-like protein [Campylobacter sp. RM13744]|uniref:tram-like protein n=1 Tax=Campylobacter molothri TaxID=1032242 RepID=UPI00301E31F5|nr:tram-like protein [Campylobacter sp. RM13744]